MKLAKIILMPAVCLSLCSCGTPLAPIEEILDCLPPVTGGCTSYHSKFPKKARGGVPLRGGQQVYSKPYKPQKLMKPGRLYGDVRRGW